MSLTRAGAPLPSLCCPPSRAKNADGPDLIGAARIGPAEILGGLERLVEGGAVDDIEAQELLLGLGEGPVDHQRRLAVLAERGGRGGGQETGDGAEAALLRQPLLHHGELGHDGIVLGLAPGADDVFAVVAEYGVEHGGAFLLQSQDEGG
jgi:hypothetical protein